MPDVACQTPFPGQETRERLRVLAAKLDQIERTARMFGVASVTGLVSAAIHLEVNRISDACTAQHQRVVQETGALEELEKAESFITFLERVWKEGPQVTCVHPGV